jgi:oligosaccharide repeat unit polymerase
MTASNMSRTAGSAFVPLRPFEVAAALLFIWSIALAVGIAALQHGRVSLLPVYAAFMLYLTVLSLPIVLPGHDSGLFNPVLFYILYHALLALARSEAPLASGMMEMHRALPHFNQAALDAAVAKNFVLKTLSLIGLYTGYSLMPYLRFRKLPVIRPKALRLKAFLWVALSGIGILVLISKAGGVGGLLMQRGLPSFDRIRADTGAHWHYLAGIATVVPVIWLAFRPKALRTLSYWIVTLSSLAFIYMARGSRSNVLIVLILIGMVWMLRWRKIPYKVIFAGLALSIVVLGVLGQFRRSTQGMNKEITDAAVETDVGEAFQSGIEELSARGIDESGPIAVVGRVPAEIDYLYGRSYLSIPFVFLPSALVGEKPPTVGRLNAEIVHDRLFTGIPAGTVGEAYWNFSYLGPLVVFLLYGAILKIIAGVYLQNHDNPVIVALYVFVLFRFRPGSDPFYDFAHALVPAVAFMLFLAFPFGGARQRRPVRHVQAVPPAPHGGVRAT